MAVGFPTKVSYANGDVFSASDINDTNGTINLLQTSTLSRAAGKNAVINGGMDVWQRGTSATASTTAFGADRWQFYRAAGGATVSRQATSDTTNLPNIQYCSRVQRNLANAGTTAVEMWQAFETVNSIPFAGKTVTLSFYARKGADFSAASNTLNIQVGTGTGTDQNPTSYTGVTFPISSTATLTTTWQRFTFTATLGSSITEMYTEFYYTPVGTAGANDYYEITGVQIELGSYATTFSRAGSNYGGELSLCQRYYFRASAANNYSSFAVGANYSTSAAQLHLTHPVAMRAGSSIDYSTLALITAAGSVATFTTITYQGFTPMGSFLAVSGSSGLVAGNGNILISNNSTSGYIALNGEL